MLLGVDVGGTFTDAVLLAPDGALFTAKVPSTPAAEADGVMAAIEAVLAAAAAAPEQISRFCHGMTVATNALLEGRTARTALIATEGFTDVLELGRQARPQLYRLCVAGPAPLVGAELRFAAPERMLWDGIAKALEPQAAEELAERVAAVEPEAVAVALLHSYRDPAHELLIAQRLRERLPDVALSLSSEIVGTFREFERTATTVLDAALSPPLAAYLRELSRRAGPGGLPEPQIMQSSGGLTDLAAAGAHGALTVLSGPAGGVAGALLSARAGGHERVACFDMGGTSCDVCLIDQGAVLETSERTIAGRPIALPALDIHTVGAGGGSLAWRDDGGALRVGPASAGASPGPACYGRGGEQPTVTDANLLLGRLPAQTPLAGGLSLDLAAAQAAVGSLARQLGLELNRCAEGIVEVAEAEMLSALRLMTVERGIDPRSFALLPFGGAGGLHAAAMARRLGIRRILCPRAAGVLSALGLAAAAPRRDASRTLMLGGPELSEAALAEARGELHARASTELGAEAVRRRVRHELRYRGQSHELAVEETGAQVGSGLGPAQLRARFEDAHEQRYGYRDEHAEIELVTMRVSVWGAAPAPAPALEPGPAPVSRPHTIRLGGRAVASRLHLGPPAPGTTVTGPSLWALGESTLLVPGGWSGGVDERGTIELHDGPGGA